MQLFKSVFSQSSLVPLAKIANAPSRSLRLLWAAVTTTMFMGLCVCITLVVIQYCRHQTVFQLDYSGRHMVYDQIPAFTICPQAQEAQRLMRQMLPNASNERFPWLDKVLMDEFRRRVQEIAPGHSIVFDAISHRLPVGQLKWDTETTAMSPIYRLLHNFSVLFRMQPPVWEHGYRLTVMEQVPNIRTFLCTTFELRSRSPNDQWSYLEIEIDQRSSLKHVAPFTIITHERGELPFSAYDRHIHTVLPPQTLISVYFSKSVTARLNTGRNPCHEGLDAKSLASDHTDTYDTYSMGEDEIQSADWNGEQLLESPPPWEMSQQTSIDLSRQTTQDPTIAWHVDFLDHVRLNRTEWANTNRESLKNTNDNVYHNSNNNKDNTTRSLFGGSKKSKTPTVSLFGTEFLYSREACGWAECCRQVKRMCNCTCSMHVLAHTLESCPAGSACEFAQCRDRQISYTLCPLPCMMTKFIKHNEMRVHGSEVNMSLGLSKLKIVRAEAVQVATEEEIFSLAKLFSEVGGLCSLFIGFSCIFLFELLEAAILMRNQTAEGEKDEVREEMKNGIEMARNEDAIDNQDAEVEEGEDGVEGHAVMQQSNSASMMDGETFANKTVASVDDVWNREFQTLAAPRWQLHPVWEDEMLVLSIEMSDNTQVNHQPIMINQHVWRERDLTQKEAMIFSNEELLNLIREDRLQFRLVVK